MSRSPGPKVPAIQGRPPKVRTAYPAWSLNIPGQAWLEYLVGGGYALPPAAQLAAVVGEINWDPAICLGIILPALVIPDGRLRSNRWPLVAAAAVAGAVLDMVGASLAPGPLLQTPIDTRSG
jgi:hypothetical protein